jgi:hypothetical protein
MTARDDIRAAAETNGWTAEKLSTWTDIFTREVPLPEGKLARFFEVAEHTPTERVSVFYTTTSSLCELAYAGPGQQSAVTGIHVSSELIPRNRRAVAVELLSRPADHLVVAELAASS